jgi:hypothetical protein
MWKYVDAFKFFGPTVKSESYLVRTSQELDALLDDLKFAEPTCPKVLPSLLNARGRNLLTRIFQLVEIIMDRLDAPLPMRLVGEAISKFNAQK